MNILVVHQNFPGQFRHILPVLVKQGHRVVGMAQHQTKDVIQGVGLHIYQFTRGHGSDVHPLAIEWEAKVLRAEACALACKQLKQAGFVPDLILGHPGWGEMLYLKELFPLARIISYAEFFYHAKGQDFGFDPEFPETDPLAVAKLHTKNANLLLAMEQMDAGLSPTRWQASVHPAWAQQKIRVIHDGVDTDKVSPDSLAKVSLPDRGLELVPGDEVITFVARNLEPVRGYHILMRALPEIMKRRPNAIILIVGGDGVSYGAESKQESYRQRFLNEVKHQLDPRRVIFLGQVPYGVFLRLLQVSRCHIYLTYPFVLSWSMLEAMSAGSLVIGSRTPPVEEVIRHGENGLLVDFFDVTAWADQVCDVLAHSKDYDQMRKAGRQTVIEGYDLRSRCLPDQLNLIQEVMA